MTNDLRYPVGKFTAPADWDDQRLREWRADIADLPANLHRAVAGLDDAQLDTPYREGGWTVRQVVHHVPDSHLNAYIRFKWAITEDAPTIKPYDEAAWATLKDSELTPVEVSLTLLESLHARWTVLLRSLQADDFRRTFNHPQSGPHDVDWLLALYSWHGNHHVAHITTLRERMKW